MTNPTHPELDRRQLLTALGATTLAASTAAMPRPARRGAPSLTVAGYAYDRVAGIADGSVPIEGAAHTFQKASIYELNRTAMGGDQRFHVQEIGLHPYMLAFANEDLRDYTLVPVFPLRTFRHKSIFVRTPRRIDAPADLKGKTVATAGYSQSSLTWIRGMLKDEYGIEPTDLKWVMTRETDDDSATKNEKRVPEGVLVKQGPVGQDESDLLSSGVVDAALSALEPRAFVEGDPQIARLFPDARAAERDYYARTGIFPIMHVVALRKDVVDEHPALPKAVFEAYSRAKAMNEQRMDKLGWALVSLPWFAAELESTRALMGDNYWPYGVAPNRKALDALFRY